MRKPDDSPCDVRCFNLELVSRLKRTLPTDRATEELAGLFQLLGDPARIRMIAALSSGEELCVCDVANVAGLSVSATSHQLKKLREAGVVVHRNDGRMAYYRLHDGFCAGLLAQARLRVEQVQKPKLVSTKAQS